MKLTADTITDEQRARHRSLITAAHPDRGGDPNRAVELNVALEQAETELGEAQ